MVNATMSKNENEQTSATAEFCEQVHRNLMHDGMHENRFSICWTVGQKTAILFFFDLFHSVTINNNRK